MSSPGKSIHRVARTGPGSVNSWVIEGDRSSVVIDCQRTPSDASLVVECIERLQKPPAAILLTHAHPDHALGLQQLLDAFAQTPRVISSHRTRDLLDQDVYGYVALTRQIVDVRLPSQLPLPTEFVAHEQQLDVDGILIRAIELGPGECEAMTAYELPSIGVVAAGDLVEHQMTPFLLEQRSGQWLRQIERARDSLAANTLLPGHGEAGDTSALLDWQADYLRQIRSAVRQATTTAGEANAVTIATESVRNRYGPLDPVALIPDLERLNVESVQAEIYQD